MSAIGLIGGTSPQSTIEYYRALVNLSIERLEPDEYPRIVITSVNLAEFIRLAATDRWDLLRDLLLREFEALRAAGAAFGAITSNTTHKAMVGAAGGPATVTPIPMLSIFDAVAGAAKARGVRTLALTGTAYTMRESFYKDAMRERGVETLAPTPEDQEQIHRMIYEELIRGVVRPESVAKYATIARRMLDRGADALLLGCTELMMPVAHQGWPRDLPVVDSAKEHAEAIFEMARGMRAMAR